LALGGCAFIVLSDAAKRGSAARGSTSGDLLALTAAVFWAAYMLTTEHARADMDTLTFNTIAVSGSVATLLVACVVLGVPLWGYSARSWAALLALGFISQL